jgi:hypothetical protein
VDWGWGCGNKVLGEIFFATVDGLARIIDGYRNRCLRIDQSELRTIDTALQYPLKEVCWITIAVKKLSWQPFRNQSKHINRNTTMVPYMAPVLF